MPNIAAMLKNEISRLSRKEIRMHTEVMRKASVQYRHSIASLKRLATKLERQVARLEANVYDKARPHAAAEQGSRVRFAAKGLRSQRERLGLSAAEYAKLVGVSAQSIYNWERGVARPRAQQIAAIVALRRINKREARARLERVETKTARKKAKSR